MKEWVWKSGLREIHVIMHNVHRVFRAGSEHIHKHGFTASLQYVKNDNYMTDIRQGRFCYAFAQKQKDS